MDILQLLGLNKNKSDLQPSEDDLVNEGLNSPIRPEYLKLLAEEKARNLPNDRGSQFLGVPSPENRAQNKLDDLDSIEKYKEQIRRLNPKAYPKELESVASAPSDIPETESKKEILPLLNRSPASDTITTNQAKEADTTQSSPLKLIPSTTDVYGDDLNDSALKDAQHSAMISKLIGGLANASSQIGTAISGGKIPAKEVGNFAIENADSGVKDIQTRREGKDKELQRQKSLKDLTDDEEMSKSDSPVSVSIRNGMHQLFPNISIPDNVSAKQLRDMGVNFGTLITAKEASDSRKETASNKSEEKSDLLALKYSKYMGDSLDTSRPRAGELGKNQGRVNAAERVEALLNQFPDGNIPKTQTREIATSIGNLLTNGSQTAVQQINELVPHTLRGRASDIAEWFTNNPTGQAQQKFIELYADTASREKNLAKEQIQEAQLKTAYGTYGKFKESNPDDFYNTLSYHTGLTPEEIKEKESHPKRNPASDSNKVKMKSPEGQIGLIPKENVEEAKKRGFQVTE